MISTFNPEPYGKLADALGSSEVTVEIINGERPITKTQAKALAEYFHVDASLFT